MNALGQNLQIDPQRLWDSLMETARIGGTEKGGIRRLALTDLDRQVRDWFKTQCEALGARVSVDEVGNMFALRPGRRVDVAPIAMGSHLDTQPTGGKFDGCLGVLAGLEVLRTLAATGYETNAPLVLVNWTNEEGSRFAPAMLGSGVHAGVFDRTYADDRTDRDGVRFAEAIEAIGYRGDKLVGSQAFSAMFELHIEQGPILEADGKTIGIVEGVQAISWFEIQIEGQESHAGSTPMPLRRDALVAAARLVTSVQALALDAAPDGVGTVGLIEASPNSRNVVPGHVFLTVDLRHPQDAALQGLEERFWTVLEALRAETGLTIEGRRTWHSPAVRFDAGCVAAVRDAAARLDLPARPIVSGAGHDAAYIARVTPTAMIFVPCVGGLSHNEAESTSFEECAAGARVLLSAVLDYDATRFENP